MKIYQCDHAGDRCQQDCAGYHLHTDYCDSADHCDHIGGDWTRDITVGTTGHVVHYLKEDRLLIVRLDDHVESIAGHGDIVTVVRSDATT